MLQIMLMIHAGTGTTKLSWPSLGPYRAQGFGYNRSYPHSDFYVFIVLIYDNL